MSDSGSSTTLPLGDADSGTSSPIFISSRFMVAALIFFFVVITFVTFLDLYARLRFGNRSRSRHHNHLIFLADRDDATAPCHGLPAEVLNAIPIGVYRSSESEEVIDCAVCLSELADGDETRLLPKCKHCFHVDCIDMWFHSHSTCPLCRNLVDATVALPISSPVTQVLASNPPYCPNGSMDQRGNERALVIEIPRRVVDAFSSPLSSPLPSSRRGNGKRSPPSRLQSFKRLMSRGMGSSGSSPCGGHGGDGDLEMGFTGSVVLGSGIGSASDAVRRSFKNL